MAKKEKVSDYIKTLKIDTPDLMEYSISVSSQKDRMKFVNRVKSIVRGSFEYKDYINFCRARMDLNKCIFYNNVTNATGKKGRISIELHHEPFTLHDIVDTVLQRYIDEGLEMNDLLIAEEVLELHYANEVGLVPLSKTAHQVVHNSTKLIVPLNMVYGEYSKFLDKYEPYIDESLYEKLEKKVNMTEALTPESFDAIKKEFTYIAIKDFEEVEKMGLSEEIQTA